MPGVEPVLVISNRPGVRALDVAARHGVPSRVLTRGGFADADARDAAIGLALASEACELALLAGYDQLLRPGYFAAFRGLTINIHPSLLPRHGGIGMTGLAVHRSVLEAGDAETGVTIHAVTSALDAGRILAQQRLVVQAGDDAEQLAQRVLTVEHRLLVETLARMAAEGSPRDPSVSMAAAFGAERGAGGTAVKRR